MSCVNVDEARGEARGEARHEGMDLRLLVDIGNSRMKSAIEEGGVLTPLATFAWHDTFLHELLSTHWLAILAGRVPDSVHVSNVAGDRLLPNLDAWCCEHFQVSPIDLYSSRRFGTLINGYDEPESLGVDRWAAMIGARAHHEGALCVVDSGTATTVDLIHADGRHLGGAILPGIYTMRRSLGKYTAALFAADGEISPFSTNTASGIAGGTGFASVGAIDRLVDEAHAVVGEMSTIVTGGESAILASLMRNPVVCDPLLVLRGVAAVADTVAKGDARALCG